VRIRGAAPGLQSLYMTGNRPGASGLGRKPQVFRPADPDLPGWRRYWRTQFGQSSVISRRRVWERRVFEEGRRHLGPPRRQRRRPALRAAGRIRGKPGELRRAPVAIYVDLVPVQARGDAFASHIAEHHGRYARTTRLCPARRGPIPAEVSSSLVADVAQDPYLRSTGRHAPRSPVPTRSVPHRRPASSITSRVPCRRWAGYSAPARRPPT
jgi:hypothetical protein